MTKEEIMSKIDNAKKLETAIKAQQAELDALKADILSFIENNGNESIIATVARAEYHPATQRKPTFDSARYKAEHPVQYERYLKAGSMVKSYVVIK
jgi:regulator of replication initiation timing